MKELFFDQTEKPSWVDAKVYLNILCDNKNVGSIGLVPVKTLSDIGIKRHNVAVFEINRDMLQPLPSRTNEFVHLPEFPLVEQDLSLLVDEDVSWKKIADSIKFMVKELKFVEEYRGEQIPEGKKSIMLRLKIGNKDSTMSAKQIDKKMKAILKTLEKKCNAVLRDE